MNIYRNAGESDVCFAASAQLYVAASSHCLREAGGGWQRLRARGIDNSLHSVAGLQTYE